MSNKGYHNKPRHLRAVEAIDRGLYEAEQITIPDGIREAVKAGRMDPELGEHCIEAYKRTRIGLLGMTAIEGGGETPDDAA